MEGVRNENASTMTDNVSMRYVELMAQAGCSCTEEQQGAGNDLEHRRGQSWRCGFGRLLGKIAAKEGVCEPTQGEGRQDDTWGTLTDDHESCAKEMQAQGAATESQAPGEKRVGG